ncbi:MAG TPA: J domain-containing protein [Polyangiaceae bacterium]|nr:J domain-containing protein [Polyangiaceae bacterium]
MQLPGRLRLTTLGDLLGSLHRACASGTLELVEVEGARAGRSHRVFFDAGLIEDVDTSLHYPRLGEILAREGLLSMAALARVARRVTEQPGKRVGEILVEEGFGSVDLVAGALRRQRASRLEALYGLSEALIRFHVPRPRVGLRQTPLTPREFLHGRPRARADFSARVAERFSGRYGARPEPARGIDSRKQAAYRVLGLSVVASPREVQRAFRKLAAEQHPDRFPNATAAEKAQLLSRFAQLSAAYHLLMG